LPFGDRSFDVAYSSTFLHHLDVAGAVTVLREMVRVSALGIVVSDLRRCVAGYLAARALAGTVWRRHLYSRHDGPVSMRAAFTTSEVEGLAERAGIRSLIEPQPFFRWALCWRRAG
jgi:predicted SAM-dependent methyltransferase